MSFSEAFKKLKILTRNDIKLTYAAEKRLEGHTSNVNSLLHFDSPDNKLVSCSWDGTIRIWSSITYECLGTIPRGLRVYGHPFNDIIKMNPSSFISCSDDCAIKSFSISSHEQLNEIVVNNTPCQLLKLTDDLFLCRSRFRMVLLSYSRFEIVKKYETRQLDNTYHPLVQSQNYPNCFYVATTIGHDPVILIDCEKDEIVKEFTGHTTSRRIKTLSLFYNSENEEILIACQIPGKIYAYNTSHPKFNTSKYINQENKKRKPYIYPFAVVTCCCLLNNQFLFCGDDEGWIHSYEISERESEILEIGTAKTGRAFVHFINLVPSKGNRSIQR